LSSTKDLSQGHHIFIISPGFTNKKIIDGSGHAFRYYGRLSKEKGLGTLLTAAARLKLDLTIAGTGPLQDLVTDYASGNSNIRYVGFKSGNELIELVSNSSFIIVPSEWYENNPMTVIEAYALGKPVIGSRLAEIPEIVKDPDTGFCLSQGTQMTLSG
jgi:glycosyltransferase involved in cell wall biosynthesis